MTVTGGDGGDGNGWAGGPEEDGLFEGVPVPPMQRVATHRRRRRWSRPVKLVAVPIVVVVLAITLWYQLNSNALGPQGRQVVLVVKEGESTSAVISQLQKDHVIASSWAFKLSDVLDGNLSVSPGGYALHENQTYGSVRAILDGAPNIYPVTVEPGYMLSEVAARINDLPGHANSSFAKVAASGVVPSSFSPAGSTNLEGLLGTGNYLVLPGETDSQILQQMVTRFEQQAAQAGLTTQAASVLGLTPYQVVTAASIVEKEGYISPNMPDVARVIYNRLAADMPLQMDSTVLYALGQDGGPVTPADEQINSPYNTYLNAGLTPTPICSPSVDALRAAVDPPAGDWLYFELVKKDGTEAFSSTFAGQLANEKLAQSRGLG
ncbi:MAG TPA: endolytic transglycosylase MltG [Acidimicrobiales bacterium]